jgi:hypothetical protein
VTTKQRAARFAVPPPAPQSKPVTLASRLVARIAPLVAFGLGLRILAAGPAVLRQYSYRGRSVSHPQIAVSDGDGGVLGGQRDLFGITASGGPSLAGAGRDPVELAVVVSRVMMEEDQPLHIGAIGECDGI